jgi:hypothetical protein
MDRPPSSGFSECRKSRQRIIAVFRGTTKRRKCYLFIAAKAPRNMTSKEPSLATDARAFSAAAR